MKRRPYICRVFAVTPNQQRQQQQQLPHANTTVMSIRYDMNDFFFSTYYIWQATILTHKHTNLNTHTRDARFLLWRCWLREGGRRLTHVVDNCDCDIYDFCGWYDNKIGKLTQTHTLTNTI